VRDFDEHDLPDFPGVDRLLGRQKTLVEPSHERDLQLDARPLRRRDHLVAFRFAHRHRFFAQNVLAGFRRGHRDLLVVDGRCGDDDRVNLRILQGCPVVRIPGFHFQLFRRLFGRGFVRVGERRQTGVRDAGPKISGVHEPCPPAPDDANPHGTFHVRTPHGDIFY